MTGELTNTPLRRASQLRKKQREELERFIKSLETEMEERLTGAANYLRSVQADEWEINATLDNIRNEYKYAIEGQPVSPLTMSVNEATC